MQVEYREMVGYFPNSDGTQSVEGLITGVKYAYDSVGNIIAIYESRPQGSYQYRRKLAEYTYDTQNQLLSETYYTYSQDGPHHFTAVTWNYAYDTAGNILSQHKTTASRAGSDQPIVKTEATEEKTYTYGNSTWQDLLTAVDDSPIVYEGQTYHNGTVSGAVESGNPIRYTNGVKTYTDLTWEHGRQLASITTGNKTYTYDYDATGIRTEKVVDGVVHSYVTQNGRVVQESFPYGNTTVIMIFSYDEQGKPFSLQYSYNGGASFAQYYYATNAQGDVEGIFFTRKNATTGKQEIHWMGYYTYDGWGNILSIIDADGYTPGNPANLMNRNPLRYRGYYYDTETGFYYASSRYYDPEICRFINADDVDYLGANGDFTSFNLFAYCGNNPVSRTDIDGHSWKDISDWFKKTWDKVKGAAYSAYYHATEWHFEGREEKNGKTPTYSDVTGPNSEWTLLPENQSIYHDDGVGKAELKYVTDDGREAVFDGDTFEPVTDPKYIGTYNYCPVYQLPDKDARALDYLKVAGSGIGHFVADMLPYYLTLKSNTREQYESKIIFWR